MSIQAVAWVLEHSEATLADRLVLIAIANHADARGWNAYPSVPLIATEARVGRTSVYRALEALESSGELAIHRRPGHSSMYGIAALQGSQPGTGEGSQPGTGGVPNTRKRGPNLVPRTVSNRKPTASAAFETCRVCAEPVPEGAGRCDACAAAGRELPWAPGRVAMPPPLPADVRAKGAEFFRALRNGDAPE